MEEETLKFQGQTVSVMAQIMVPIWNCTIDAVFVPTLAWAKSASLSNPSDDPLCL